MPDPRPSCCCGKCPPIKAVGDLVFEAVTRAVTFGDYSQTAAAREALKPIRELHRPQWLTDPDGYGDYQRCSCGFPSWRECNTAKLIYTTEELTEKAR